MPKDFLQGASLTPTFEALMVKFGGKIGTLYQMLKNAIKKHPLQNRTNVQIKGGGGKGVLNNVKKKLHFSYTMASLMMIWMFGTSHEALPGWRRIFGCPSFPFVLSFPPRCFHNAERNRAWVRTRHFEKEESSQTSFVRQKENCFIFSTAGALVVITV